MEWLSNNYQWVFSGIGTSLVILIITILLKKNKEAKNIKMKQKSGDNSLNIQIGGDVNNGK
jgi:hypothetical protein